MSATTPEELDKLRAQVRDPDSLARKLSGIANDAANRVPENMPGLASIAGDLAVYDAGKAAGYAAAVADIRQMIEDRRETVKRIGVTSRESGLIAAVYGVLGDLQKNLDAGAHVGAAKKGEK